MIMVIGGRCRENLPLQKNILKTGYRKKKKQENEKTQKDHQKNLKTDHWTDGETATWEEFLTSTWCRKFHLLVRRILKKDETLGLPDEQEKAYLKQYLQVCTTGKKWQKSFIHCQSSPYFSHR